MEVVIKEFTNESLEEFADKNNLVLEVVERGFRPRGVKRYYARFQDSETKHGCILSSTSGDGDSVEEAMLDYARSISNKLLVIGAYRDYRKEIRVPNLIKVYKDEGVCDEYR